MSQASIILLRKTFFIIRAPGSFFNVVHRPASFTKPFYGQTKVLIDEPRIRHLKQNNEKYPTIATSLDRNVHQTKTKSHLIKFVVISTMLPFGYNAIAKS